MTNAIPAVYRDGVFRPDTPPDLPDGTAVRLIVEPEAAAPPPFDPEELLACIRAIAAKVAEAGPIEHTARDHDRILYGGPKGAL